MDEKNKKSRNSKKIKKTEKSKRVKLVCSICGQEILKNPNISGKQYAVRKADPIICDMCAHDLVDIDEENQYKLEAKNDALLAKTSLENEKKMPSETVTEHQNVKLTDIISSVKAVVKGQDEQVKTISTAIYKNQRIDELEIKSNIIILGDSGSGKTETIKVLASMFKIPYVIEDATRYTEAGYFGESVDDMLKNLYKVAGNSIAKAQNGILILDEGDKKEKSSDGGRDVSGENVLFSLLKVLEGTKVPLSDKQGDPIGIFDTSKLTIVFIGAFPGLVKIREKRLKVSGQMGFVIPKENKSIVNEEYIANDFIEGGFPKEFIGRFDIVVELNRLTLENLEDIIKNSEKSTFMRYVKVLEKKNLKLTYSDDVIKEIAIEAQKLNIGARGIKKIVQYIFKDIMFQMLTDDEKYTECIITKEIVHDPTNYTMK